MEKLRIPCVRKLAFLQGNIQLQDRDKGVPDMQTGVKHEVIIEAQISS